MPAFMSWQRGALATFVLVLVILAFARAYLASSTGIRMVGDAAEYEAIASTMTLGGRAPFIYRPLVPLTVGFLFPGRLILGFGIACGLAMFAALFTAGALARNSAAGHIIAAILFLNYQVLFGAANPGRLDVVVLAVQLAFVWLALERNDRFFFILLPLSAVLKESLLLGLAALAMLAFRRVRHLWAKLGASAGGFVALHMLVRWIAEPSASMPPYADGVPSAAAMLEMAATNLSATTALTFLVSWGGLCFVALYLAFGGGRGKPDPLLLGVTAFLLVFPIPLATDLHRAWFELLAPMVIFLVLVRTRTAEQPAVLPPLMFALIASAIPYATRLVADEHLYLLILQERLSTSAGGALVITLATAAAALAYWISPKTPTTGDVRRPKDQGRSRPSNRSVEI